MVDAVAPGWGGERCQCRRGGEGEGVNGKKWNRVWCASTCCTASHDPRAASITSQAAGILKACQQHFPLTLFRQGCQAASRIFTSAYLAECQALLNAVEESGPAIAYTMDTPMDSIGSEAELQDQLLSCFLRPLQYASKASKASKSFVCGRMRPDVEGLPASSG